MTLPSDPPSDEVEALRAALAAEQAARREAEARAPRPSAAASCSTSWNWNSTNW
jgi:hypothetical protein